MFNVTNWLLGQALFGGLTVQEALLTARTPPALSKVECRTLPAIKCIPM